MCGSSDVILERSATFSHRLSGPLITGAHNLCFRSALFVEYRYRISLLLPNQIHIVCTHRSRCIAREHFGDGFAGESTPLPVVRIEGDQPERAEYSEKSHLIARRNFSNNTPPHSSKSRSAGPRAQGMAKGVGLGHETLHKYG